MNQAFNLESYAEDFAQRCKLVQHSESSSRYFSANSLGDLDGFITNLYNKKPPYVVSISETVEDNLSEDASRLFYTILILDTEEKAAKSIARSFKSKLLWDKENQTNGLYGLDISSIRTTTVAPLSTLTGLMVTFWVADGNDLVYNPEDFTQ